MGGWRRRLGRGGEEGGDGMGVGIERLLASEVGDLKVRLTMKWLWAECLST